MIGTLERLAVVASSATTAGCRRAWSAGLVLALCLLAWPPGAMPAAPDPVAGEAVYQRCIGCHSLDRNRTGPKHCGLLGRVAGSVPGFDYSQAMREAGLTWDEATLGRFLAAPTAVVPGTSMAQAGIIDAQDRIDLVAYLASVSHDPERCAVNP